MTETESLADQLLAATINCPHVIDSDRIVLHFDRSKPGHNALNQLSRRLAALASSAPAVAAPTEPDLAATVYVGKDKLEVCWHGQLPEGVHHLFRAADGAPAVAAPLRMLTNEEVFDLWDEHYTDTNTYDRTPIGVMPCGVAIRKFCDVNGLTLGAPAVAAVGQQPVHPNHLPDLRYALDALRLAREAIEPLTEAQIKLHRIRKDTDERIDAAIVGMRYIIKRTEEAAARSPAAAPAVLQTADGVKGSDDAQQ